MVKTPIKPPGTPTPPDLTGKAKFFRLDMDVPANSTNFTATAVPFSEGGEEMYVVQPMANYVLETDEQVKIAVSDLTMDETCHYKINCAPTFKDAVAGGIFWGVPTA